MKTYVPLCYNRYIKFEGEITLKINDMDKYQLTEKIGKLKEHLTNPKVGYFGVPEEIIKEILDPPTDSEGYVHKYYLKESTKSFIEVISEFVNMR